MEKLAAELDMFEDLIDDADLDSLEAQQAARDALADMSETADYDSETTEEIGSRAVKQVVSLGNDLSWQERALCAQTDPEEFYPERGGTTHHAKKVCTNCDVRIECLEYALEKGEHFGIWGGLSERERARLRKIEPGESVIDEAEKLWRGRSAEIVGRALTFEPGSKEFLKCIEQYFDWGAEGRLSTVQKIQCLALSEQGKSDVEIAEELGMERAKVYSVLTAMQKRYSPELWAALLGDRPEPELED